MDSPPPHTPHLHNVLCVLGGKVALQGEVRQDVGQHVVDGVAVAVTLLGL